MEITTYEQVQIDRAAVALGKFQGLHRGHMLLLDKIRELKKEGLTSVVFTINMYSDRVLYLPEERYEILADAGVDVDIECEFTPEFGGLLPEMFVRDILVDRLHVAYVVVGEDFRFGCNRAGTVDRLVQYGLKYDFRVIAYEKLAVNDDVVSSSLIRNLIDAGDLRYAECLMGRPYSVSGVVGYGKQLGRKIGFPTINIYTDQKKLLPPSGVYESHLCIDGIIYKGITNIGDNPTTDGDGRMRVETHIIGYDGDMYGRNITVYMDSFIRGEKKFQNVEELRRQIDMDKKSVMHQ